MEKIGVERMAILLDKAIDIGSGDDAGLALNYIERSKKIGMKLNQRVSREYEGMYCKKCLTPFVSK